MKIRIFILFILMFEVLGAAAQQKPQYTQYIFNQYLLNPALSGIENYIDFKAGYRKQWTGIEGAPQTSFISVHMPLGDQYLWSNALTAFPEDEENPMGRNYMQIYNAAPPHHGVGFSAVVDKAGPFKRLDANLSYAYHIRLSADFNLSAGIAAGISNINLNINALNFEDQSQVDPVIHQAIINQTLPDINLGVWFYGARLFAGLSVQQVWPQKLRFSNTLTDGQGRMEPHFLVTGGYKLYMSPELAVVPSIMFKYVQPMPSSIDFNLKFAYKDKFWIGGSYRSEDAITAMLGFNIGKTLNLSYSYDFTQSALSKVSQGSHEIVIGLLLNNKYKVPSHIKIW